MYHCFLVHLLSSSCLPHDNLWSFFFLCSLSCFPFSSLLLPTVVHLHTSNVAAVFRCSPCAWYYPPPSQVNAHIIFAYEVLRRYSDVWICSKQVIHVQQCSIQLVSPNMRIEGRQQLRDRNWDDVFVTPRPPGVSLVRAAKASSLPPSPPSWRSSSLSEPPWPPAHPEDLPQSECFRRLLLLIQDVAATTQSPRYTSVLDNLDIGFKRQDRVTAERQLVLLA